jgi:hypothetical protein
MDAICKIQYIYFIFRKSSIIVLNNKYSSKNIATGHDQLAFGKEHVISYCIGTQA